MATDRGPGLEPNWSALAACKSTDPSVFFPKDLVGVVAAKTICRDCPVIEECLDHAIVMGEHGVWGGTSDDERADLAKARRRGFMAYHGKLQEVREALGRTVAGHPDERPWVEASTCPRCGAEIPAGRWPPDRNGPDATCGRPATYNKGCRCAWCKAAKSRYQSRKSD